jgi:hypothetical protein
LVPAFYSDDGIPRAFRRIASEVGRHGTGLLTRKLGTFTATGVCSQMGALRERKRPSFSETSGVDRLAKQTRKAKIEVQGPTQRRGDIRERIENYVETLVQLYEMTDPGKGSASEENKLERARHAITVWWYMFGEILLWAQSQITGYELGKANPEFISSLGKTFGEEVHPDSHLLEYIGLNFSWNHVNGDDQALLKVATEMQKHNAELDDPAIRYVIRELVDSRSANSSFWRFPLQRALFALNLGHVDDLLKPVRIRRQGDPVRLLHAKMMALRHVYYHIGKGIKKYRALEMVATELGQSTETLRSWEKEITGDDDLMMDITGAELAGELEELIDSFSLSDLEKYLATDYHRNTSDIEYAKLILESIRSNPLDKIRKGILKNRRPKKSGV